MSLVPRALEGLLFLKRLFFVISGEEVEIPQLSPTCRAVSKLASASDGHRREVAISQHRSPRRLPGGGRATRHILRNLTTGRYFFSSVRLVARDISQDNKVWKLIGSMKGKGKSPASSKEKKDSKASAAETARWGLNLEDTVEQDDWSSAWQEVLEGKGVWGGRTRGGRGVQRITGFTRDISVEGITLSFSGKELLQRTRYFAIVLRGESRVRSDGLCACCPPRRAV